MGMDFSGSWPGDTVFMQVSYKPEKVPSTLSLLNIMASPNHGAVFDIVANPDSIELSIKNAVLLATNEHEN